MEDNSTPPTVPAAVGSFAPLEPLPPAAPAPLPSAAPPPPGDASTMTRPDGYIPPPPTAMVATTNYRSVASLGRAMTIVFGLWLPVGIAMVLALRHNRQAFENGVSLADAERSDQLLFAASTAQTLLSLGTIVLFIVWFHRSYCNVSTLSGRAAGHKTGWAIGWWFVPFANFAMPVKLAGEIHRASSANPYNPSMVLIGFWWTALLFARVVMVMVGVTAAARLEEATPANTLRFDLVEFRAAWLNLNTINTVTTVSAMVAAVLALAVVRQLTTAQERKAQELGVG